MGWADWWCARLCWAPVLGIGLFAGACDPPVEELEVVEASQVPIVFVSRTPQSHGSFFWPPERGGPKEMPGVGPRSRVRPAGPSKLLVRRADGSIETLIDGANPTDASLHLVDVNAPSVSYDGYHIVFAGLAAGGDREVMHDPRFGTRVVGAWRLFRIGADGTGLVQLTHDDDTRDEGEYARRFGPELADDLLRFDDFDPVFLPTGNVAFSSTRWPSTSHFGGQRTSQIYVVDFDGGEPWRTTSERNGADRPVVDPITGELVFARWWHNAHGESSDHRHSWHASRIRPDGYGLLMFAGFRRSDAQGHYYGGGMSDDGDLYGNYFPVVNMTEAAGFGGVRRVQRGSTAPVPVAGVTGVRTDVVSRDVDGQGAPSTGIYRSRYAADAVVLPNPEDGGRRTGRLLMSMTATEADLNQDYGLWSMNADGSDPVLEFDLAGTAELRAQVLLPRELPPLIRDRASSAFTRLPPEWASTEEVPADGEWSRTTGSFLFHPLNVYANADVDVDIVSAIPIGSADVLRGFTDYQRGGHGDALDEPILLGVVPVDAGGAALLTAPGNLPLFEDLLDAEGELPRSGGHYGDLEDDGGSAFVAGHNYAPNGFHGRCVGCHAGHSLIVTHQDEDEARWSNLAPGARVLLSSVASPALTREMEASLVDRRVENLRDPGSLWRRAADDSGEAWARLVFPVPVWVRDVRLYAQPEAQGVSGGGADISRAEVRLFGDVDALQKLGHREVAGVDAEGTTASFVGELQKQGVRVVEVRLDSVTGGAAGLVGLAEVEVIARGDVPPEGRITAAVPMIPVEDREDPFSGRIYPGEEATATPAVAEAGVAEPAFEDCPDGSIGAVQFEAGALPIQSADGVQVQLSGMEVGEDGSIRLPSLQSAERPVYRVIVGADCGDHSCLWTGIALDRDSSGQSRLMVSARAGDTPSPDRSWTPKTTNQSAEAIPLMPPLYGRFLELSFTFTAADRTETPVLHGFRACYGGV